MWYRVVLSCLLLVLHDVLPRELPRNVHYKDVRIDAGAVRGFLAEDGDYFAFLGIPYAAPPVGDLRFKAPIPPQPWENIFIANHTAVCPQRGFGDEDCLIVNVFTPIDIVNSSLPVLVYIHGGSFLIGSGQTKGVQPLIKENVITVTLNYRLGALGFLCLGTEEAPGNAGLKDQVAALKWVQSNIVNFGGDPNKVTLYGMSAGGTSVEMLFFSKMAEGLFHGAIIESGSALSVWSVDAHPIKTAKDMAKLVTSEDAINLNQLIDFYKKIPADTLSRANYKFYENLIDGTFGFVPCLEKKLLKIDALLTETPKHFLRKGKYNKVPIMFIFASLEGLFLRSSDYYELNYKDRMNANFKDFLPADLKFNSEDTRVKIADNVRKYYFGDEFIGNKTLKGYFDYFGDNLVLDGLLNSAIAHAENDVVVFLMEFAYKGKLGSKDTFFDSINIAGHGDAIKYGILNSPVEDKNDEITVERMSKIVANFMKYRNPSPQRNELIPIDWPAVQKNKVSYLRLGKDLEIFENPFWDRKLFWDNLYDMYRRPISQVNPDMF